MTEPIDFATPDAFTFTRRRTQTSVPGYGSIQHRNLNGLEHSRIKAAVQQTARSEDEDASADAFSAELVEWWIQCVEDPETSEPMFTASDRKRVACFDSGLLEYVAQACAKFCELPSQRGTVKN